MRQHSQPGGQIVDFLDWILGALRMGFYGLVIYFGSLAIHWVFTTEGKGKQ